MANDPTEPREPATTTEAPREWAPSAPPPGRRLVRRREDRMLGGVCAGIAATYRIDVTLVRLGFVLTAIAGGIGVLVYAAAWILVPEGSGPGDPPAPPRRFDVSQVVGFALLGLGAIVLLDRLAWHGESRVLWHGESRVLWSLALVAAGLTVLVLRTGDVRGAGPRVIGVTFHRLLHVLRRRLLRRGRWLRRRALLGERAERRVRPETGLTGATDAGENRAATAAPPPTASGLPPEATTSAWGTPTRWPVPPVAEPASPRRPRSPLGPITLGLVLVFVGAASLLDVTGAVAIDTAIVIAGALVLTGAALVVGAWFGRARPLIALGLVLTTLGGVAVLGDLDLRGGVGERHYQPSSVRAVRDRYDLAVGQMVLDLRETGPVRSRLAVEAHVGIGELIVYVPDDVTVRARSHAGAGEVEVFGTSGSGVDVDHARSHVNRASPGRIELDARVGLGHVNVVALPAGVDLGDLR